LVALHSGPISPWLIVFMGPQIADDSVRRDVYNICVSAQKNSLIERMLKCLAEVITMYDGVSDNFRQDVDRVNGRKTLSIEG
jgi:hypothetical protein